MSALVYCEAHNPRGTPLVAHPETSDCVHPHYVRADAPTPSMSAVETLDPREAVTA